MVTRSDPPTQKGEKKIKTKKEKINQTTKPNQTKENHSAGENVIKNTIKILLQKKNCSPAPHMGLNQTQQKTPSSRLLPGGTHC